MKTHHDTIAAVSTPPGVGGIGIVRVSGPEAEEIGRKLFRPAGPVDSLESHRVYHGDIVSPTEAVIDEVLAVLMRGPRSYTGEDILEIHCHGGPAVVLAVLNAVLKAGARAAKNGEFTERAFLNDRLDLAQAEAVMDLISARTEEYLEKAVSHLKGGLSRQIASLRDSVLDLLARTEVLLDFPEDMPEDATAGAGLPFERDVIRSIEGLSAQTATLLATYSEGKLLRDGLDVVIAGRTNVGKSSLLNHLLGEERAIVTPIPGTTRDFIAESIVVRGIPMKLTDTAGIRASGDLIERKGIEKVWEKLADADLVIFLLDGSMPLSDQDREIAVKIGEKRIVTAVNKNDLPKRLSDEDIQAVLPGAVPVWISAKYGDGVADLKERLHCAALGGKKTGRGEAVISNVRHKAALEKAQEMLAAAKKNILEGQPPELSACDLREAADALGDIIGVTTSEDVLDRIFSKFCIGK